MQPFIHSAFLQALGYAIANSLWQTALLWMAVMTINGVFKLSATAKYRIGVLAQSAGFVWFLVTLFYYYKTSGLAIAQAEILQASSNTYLVAQNADQYENSVLSFIVRAEQVLPYLSVAYLFLLSFLVVKWIKSYRYTNLIQHNGLQKIDVEWKLFVKKLARELGIKAEVKIYLSEIVTSPLTIGFLKPVILIPVAGINHLTVPQLEAIILHEMAHIRRFDYLMNLFVSIIELCLFFNPFTQLISRMIKNERENSCDDWVLQYQYQPAMYAEALLRIAYLQSTPSFAMAAAGNKQVLLTRVKRMLDQNQQKFNYRQHLIALLLMTGILTSLAWFEPAKTKSHTTSTAAVQPAVIEPLAVKVDNPLFNPVFFLSKPLKEEVKKAAKEAETKFKQAQIVLRDLHIPSITNVATEKIQAMNLDRMGDDLLRLNNDLKTKQKDLSALNDLKLNSWISANVSGNDYAYYSDSLVAYNKSLNNLFVAQAPAAPIVLSFEKIGEEMKKAKDEMLKLSKQGLLKFDEKAFDKEFNAAIKMVPMTIYNSDNENAKRWTENAQTEIRRRTESLKDNAAQLQKRREQLKTLQGDSLRPMTWRVQGGTSFWTTDDDNDTKVAQASGGPKVSVTTTANAPAYYAYGMRDNVPTRRRTENITGPEDEEAPLAKTVTVSGHLLQPRGGSAPAAQTVPPKLRTVSCANCVIVDGKIVEIKQGKRILRVESF